MTEGVWLTLRDVVLDWNRSALLRRRVEVTELSAAEILLPRLPVAARHRSRRADARGPGLFAAGTAGLAPDRPDRGGARAAR